eukprot:4251537-Lingulodinium_polyedra.AAC.1
MPPCVHAPGRHLRRQRTLPRGLKRCQAGTRRTRPRPERCWSMSASRRGRRCRRNRCIAVFGRDPSGISSVLCPVRRQQGAGRHARPR